jgi:hypothetical protein
MLGFVISLFLGWFGKWRFLGLVYLLDLVVVAIVIVSPGAGDAEFLAVPLIPLVEVAVGYAIGAGWRRLRRGAWPRDAVIVRLPDTFQKLDGPNGSVMVWEVETPVLTGPVAKVMAVVLAVAFALMFGLFFAMRPEAAGTALMIAGIAVGAMVALFALVVLGVLFNRVRKRFTVTPEGYTSTIVDGRLGWATVGGGAVQTPGRAAPALAGTSRLSDSQRWDRVERFRFDPDNGRVLVKLHRRGWDVIHCPVDGFVPAAREIRRLIDAAGVAAPKAADVRSKGRRTGRTGGALPGKAA